MMRVLSSFVVLTAGLTGCSGPGDDVRTVRLELDNQADGPVSGWLRAQTAEGSIMLQSQQQVEAGQSSVKDGLLVMDGLDHFLARLAFAGAAEESLTVQYDSERCRSADPVVFRVVAVRNGVLPGTRYEAELDCDAV